jgi:inhibitor of KinA sporulation pathway (predicted exonuclease)
MGANLTRVLVVDVEATCWETMDEQGTMPNEIIEIGICELNPRTGIISNGSSYVVKPRFSPVSAFCTTLTGWTQEAVDGGRDIMDTIQLVKSDYGLTSNHVWFSCGEYDRIKLGSAGGGSLKALYGIERLQNPFALLRAHYNIKTLFALKFKLNKEMGMARMLAHIKEPLDGRHHNGLADALNIAKLVRAVLS